MDARARRTLHCTATLLLVVGLLFGLVARPVAADGPDARGSAFSGSAPGQTPQVAAEEIGAAKPLDDDRALTIYQRIWNSDENRFSVSRPMNGGWENPSADILFYEQEFECATPFP